MATMDQAEERSMRIESTKLSTRTREALKAAGLETLGDIVDMGSRVVNAQPRIGSRAMNEIHVLLDDLGMSFPQKSRADSEDGIELRPDMQRLSRVLTIFDEMDEVERRAVWLFLGDRYHGHEYIIKTK